MKRHWLIVVIVLLLGLTFIMESIANQQKSLKSLLSEKRNHRRVLLLYSRDGEQQALLEQQETLRKAKDDLAERDMDVIVVTASTISEPDRQFLLSSYNLPPAKDFAGWLIGKDGGVKQTYKRPVSLQELFQLVDTMPMRKQEMRH